MKDKEGEKNEGAITGLLKDLLTDDQGSSRLPTFVAMAMVPYIAKLLQQSLDNKPECPNFENKVRVSEIVEDLKKRIKRKEITIDEVLQSLEDVDEEGE